MQVFCSSIEYVNLIECLGSTSAIDPSIVAARGANRWSSKDVIGTFIHTLVCLPFNGPRHVAIYQITPAAVCHTNQTR